MENARGIADPASPLTGLRSVDLELADLDGAIDFYTDVWGLALADRDADRAWLRATGTDPHVLALHRAPISRIRSMTFRAAATTDLAALSARAVAAGATIALPIGDWGEHGAGRGFALRDRAGRAIRIVQDDHPAVPLPFDPDRAERLAHVNFNSDDVMRDVAWFEAALGFAMTDHSKMMRFVRTNSDHHTIGSGLGRPRPGDNVFTYFVDPHGLVIEHTAEVLQVDAAYRVGGPDDWTWPPGRVDQRGLCPPQRHRTARRHSSPFSLPERIEP